MHVRYLSGDRPLRLSPLRLLFERYKIIKFLMFPISGGMEPLI
jgi:hypothetical protein